MPSELDKESTISAKVKPKRSSESPTKKSPKTSPRVMSSQKVGEEKAGPESQSLKRGSSFKSRKESIAENNSILKKESSYLSNTANGQSKRYSNGVPLYAWSVC